MNSRLLFTLPLAAALAIPGMAQQQGSTDSQQPSASSASSSSSSTAQTTTTTTTQDTSSDQNMSAHQPLQPEMRQGFWGKINPMARKKYVQRQLSPIRNRVNELDDLTAANTRDIKDVDARAQQGIQMASAKASLADQHATDAGNRAQQANTLATQANTRLGTVEQVVGNIDHYTPATQTEIRFRSGQTALSPKAKDALDDMTGNLKDEKGYIIEVQGFSATAGQAGVQSSQAMANSVVRYLVEKNQIPVYRIFVMGMGNAKVPVADNSTAHAKGNRVEISLLKNNVDQLASAQSNSGMSSTMSSDNGYSNSQNNGYSHSTTNGYANQPTTGQPSTQQQPSNMNSAPTSNTTPPQQ
jgi:outer membrane protein OmpA-like peptidoglycan-associated protein